MRVTKHLYLCITKICHRKTKCAHGAHTIHLDHGAILCEGNGRYAIQNGSDIRKRYLDTIFVRLCTIVTSSTIQNLYRNYYNNQTIAGYLNFDQVTYIAPG